MSTDPQPARAQPSGRRRALVALVAAGGVIAAAGVGVLFSLGGHGATRDAAGAPEPPADVAAVRALLEGLRGRAFDGFTLTDFTGVVRGGVRLTLSAADGARVEVDLLRRDADGPPGLADTPSCSLYLLRASGPDAGPSPTDEAQGRAVQALAAELAAHEAAAPLPSLLTLRERERRFH